MKTLFIQTFLFAFILISNQIFAQAFEGKLIMKMEVLNLPPEMEQMKSMMESTITTYTKGKKSRVEMANPMTGNTIIITDLVKNEVVMCMDVLGQKSAIVSTTDEYSKSKQQQMPQNLVYTHTNEQKTIAGHICKKSIATIEHDGEKMQMEIWCAPDIQNMNMEMKEAPGMPLEYSMNIQQFTMHFLTNEIVQESVPDSKFEVPAGYTKKTMEEFQKQMGGAGGK